MRLPQAGDLVKTLDGTLVPVREFILPSDELVLVDGTSVFMEDVVANAFDGGDVEDWLEEPDWRIRDRNQTARQDTFRCSQITYISTRGTKCECAHCHQVLNVGADDVVISKNHFHDNAVCHCAEMECPCAL